MKEYYAQVIQRPLRSWRWARTRVRARVVEYDPYRHHIAVLAGRSKADWQSAIRRPGTPWARVVAESPDFTLDYEGGRYGFGDWIESAKRTAEASNRAQQVRFDGNWD